MEQEEKKKGLFSRIREGLDKTRKNIMSGVENVFKAFVKIDDELFEELEEALVLADIGAVTSAELIDTLRTRAKKERLTDAADVRRLLIEEITAILEEGNSELVLPSPTVMLIIGVNGVGKTTSIGKIASIYKQGGKKVIIAAADTFRAAAVEQIEIWGERSGVPVIRRHESTDPASVVYDSITAARARKADLLICDTAGRLQNKKNLMEELRKMTKIIEREYPEAHVETLLVVDATTGQNAVSQARVFKEIADITGIILTKLDGTAKGGVIIPIKNELKLPVRFIGVGEGIDDLQPFDAEQFAKALFEREKENEERS